MPLNFSLLHHRLLNAVIQSPHAKWAFAQRTKQLILIESLKDCLRHRFFMQQPQVAPIARQRFIQHPGIIVAALQCTLLYIAKPLLKNSLDCRPVAAVNCRRQLADTRIAAETIALLQQTEAIA